MDTNRVWIYLSNKPFDPAMEKGIETAVQHFLSEWNAHGTALHARYEVLHHRFLVILVDEEKCSASGCSIDKQFQFIKMLEKTYGIVLLDRLLVAYRSGKEVEVKPVSAIANLLQTGVLHEESLVFNTAVANEQEYKNAFEVPLKESWLNRYIPALK